MAALSKNKWYLWYLREAEPGHLTLPPYEKNEDGSIKIYYGELFCRVEDCSKSDKKFSATNNLHTHLKAHEGITLTKENKGGRVPQKEVDAALKWYKGLWQGSGQNEQGLSAATGSPAVSNALPALPLKRGGTVHVTNMRKMVSERGQKLPCGSCESRNECCKDINKCDYFVLFDCGELAPTPTTPNSTDAAAAIEAQLNNDVVTEEDRLAFENAEA